MKLPEDHVILILMCGAVAVSALDISVKGDGCASFDSCAIKDLFRTCSCDEDCDVYGTCCLDAERFPEMSTSKTVYHCHSDRTTTPVFTKESCTENFRGNPDYVTSCMNIDSDQADMLNNLLVSSTKTKITYKNINCGICNDEDERDLIYWTVEVSCPSKHVGITFKEGYIRKNLYFNEEFSEWGLKAREEFVQCAIRFHQPDYMVARLKYCAPNEVSSCPEDYTDQDVVTKCSYYHGERKHKLRGTYYRNVHCALCNNVTLKELDCVGRTYGHVSMVSGFDLIKVIFTSGSWLEREGTDKFKCSSSFSYDPFKKRCRKVTETSNLAMSSATSMAAQISIVIFGFMSICINKYL